MTAAKAAAGASGRAGTVDLDTPLLGPVGKKAADALEAKLGLHTVGDLVRHYPRRYVDRGKLTEIAGLELGEHVTVLAEVEKVTMRDMRARRGKLMQVVLTDGQGRRLDATFFNPYKLVKVMVPGLRALFWARSRGSATSCSSRTPSSSRSTRARASGRSCRSTRRRRGSTRGRSRGACGRCWTCSTTRPTPCRPTCAGRRTSPTSARALRRIHLPETEADQYTAKNRLVWDEAMGVQLALGLRRQQASYRPAAANPLVRGGLLDSFDARLPFELTAGQRSVGAEIAADLAPRHPMNRLCRARSGPGKTVVALRAMLQVVDTGGQAVMLAPDRGARRAARPLAALAAGAARPGRRAGRRRAGTRSPC